MNYMRDNLRKKSVEAYLHFIAQFGELFAPFCNNTSANLGSMRDIAFLEIRSKHQKDRSKARTLDDVDRLFGTVIYNKTEQLSKHIPDHPQQSTLQEHPRMHQECRSFVEYH